MSAILSTLLFLFHLFVVIVQQYKYRDLTVREITNVISQYKDLKPLMDAYGKSSYTELMVLCGYILYAHMMANIYIVFVNRHVIFFYLVFNDGSTRDLLSLTGTVPVSYRGKECLLCFLNTNVVLYKKRITHCLFVGVDRCQFCLVCLIPSPTFSLVCSL